MRSYKCYWKKRDLPIVAKESMNITHYEDVDLINRVYETLLLYKSDSTLLNEDALQRSFLAWFEHTIEHFKGEENAMRECGFPPYAIHKSEHDSALAKMDKIFRDWMQTKDLSMMQNYLENELPQWLIMHIGSMDRATAMFLEAGLSPCSAAHSL